jgi:hypothetical protein
MLVADCDAERRRHLRRHLPDRLTLEIDGALIRAQGTGDDVHQG